MDNVLTLVGSADAGLSPDLVEQVLKTLHLCGGETGQLNWLAPGKSVDVPFAGITTGTAETSVRENLGQTPVDLLAQANTNRRKKLLVADMDSTIVTGETLDDLAELVGIGERISTITARAMNGEMNFEQALHERISLLRGVPATVLQRTADRLRLNPGAETLVRTMAAHGAYTALVSGGFRFFTQLVADRTGFDFNQGNDLEIVNEFLTGQVQQPIVTKDVKVETLSTLAAENGLALSETLAVGDGANDLPMLLAAGLGVAYYAKPVVVAQARAQVAYTDLETLLFYQGYAEEAFVRTPFAN